MFPYNPIELAWSNLKRKVRKQNKDFKPEAVRRVIYEVSKSITVELWSSFCAHVEKEAARIPRSCPKVKPVIVANKVEEST